MKICKIYSFWILIFSMLLILISMNLLIKDKVYLLEYELLNFNSVSLIFSLLIDWMSCMFMGYVLFISSMVILYSEDYMKGDLNISRFIMLILLFIISMLLLIISPNLVSILLGWDGLGLVSYLLVIYYQNVKSYNAGMLTALSNRIGDAALLLSISWMMNYGSWSYIYYLNFMKSDFSMQVLVLFIVLAAFTKSAQIPFSSWLPAAMAAPTPISSLVHSSTLVTAGVYLLIRFQEAFSSSLMFLMMFLSMMTMLMSGIAANFENDLKKIIALSTLSQLGFMMSILFLGSVDLAFFHLLIHALFKALMFMCAGIIIHNFSGCQDIRYMGSLINQMPVISSIFFFSNMALCGMPFLSGFYSKDLILESMSMGYMNMFMFFIFYLSIGLTVMYTFRLINYLVLGDYNYYSLCSIQESNNLMMKSLFGLLIFIVISGSMFSWIIFIYPMYFFLPLMMKLLSFLMILLGIYLGLKLSKMSINMKIKSLSFLNLVKFQSFMWNMPILSTYGLNHLVLNLGQKLNYLDQGWMEYYGSKKLFFLLVNSSKGLQKIFMDKFKILLFLFLIIIFTFILII
ncbi:NADH dehydrogenase subunit 5 (mitochondrion) [Cylas formicarius]|uniref:NADH-ubiquinone oxidoreductase chain 5 n=1 Tax=Cylas formicarius TaxID=197179 RepID=A0A6G6C6I1_CYLFO|nr:NADH dehydrogenase subunit 5 [Cylas formicarius]QID76642.1 NADH dehydrogenase subunit 5 [Cylas formicarius]